MRTTIKQRSVAVLETLATSNILDVVLPFVRTIVPAIAAVLMTMLCPELVLAQDAFTNANTQMDKVIKLIGYGCIAGGLVCIIKSGLKVSEKGEGWAGVGVGVVLIIIGFKVSTGGATSANSAVNGQ